MGSSCLFERMDVSMLRLRPYKRSDAAYIMQWVPDEQANVAWCFNQLDWPLDQAAFDRYQARIEEEPNSWIMTALDEAGTPVGCLSMKRANYEEGRVHLAAIIVDSSRRGQGLGTELLHLACRYAFDLLGLTRVTLNVFEHNIGARVCYRKAGFRDVDYVPDVVRCGGVPWNRCVMARDK